MYVICTVVHWLGLLWWMGGFISNKEKVMQKERRLIVYCVILQQPVAEVHVHLQDFNH